VNNAAACHLYFIQLIRHGYRVCPSVDGEILEALSTNRSGQILYRATSLKQKPRTGYYETFWAIGTADLLEDHSEFHYLEAFISNTYLLIAHSMTMYQLYNLLRVK
jgi:hypothetical protein